MPAIQRKQTQEPERIRRLKTEEQQLKVVLFIDLTFDFLVGSTLADAFGISESSSGSELVTA